MNIKSMLAKPFASVVHRQIKKEQLTAVADQQSILNQLVKSGKSTIFGKEHKFDQINSPLEFQEGVPLRDYEALKEHLYRVQKLTSGDYFFRKHKSSTVTDDDYKQIRGFGEGKTGWFTFNPIRKYL